VSVQASKRDCHIMSNLSLTPILAITLSVEISFVGATNVNRTYADADAIV